VSLVLPELKGKLDGMSLRVPTPNVSVVTWSSSLQEDHEGRGERSAQGLCRGQLKGILQFEESPLVSIDFKGNPILPSWTRRSPASWKVPW